MKITENQRSGILRAAARLGEVLRIIHETEMELEKLNDERRELTEHLLPDLMDQAEMDKVGLSELGVDLKAKTYVRAVLPKDPDLRQQAIQWLVDEGHGDLIKEEVSVSFGRKEHNAAKAVAAAIEEQLIKMDMLDKPVTMKTDVHHMTLSAFVREQLENGVVIPLDTLGATTGRIVEMKRR